MTSPIIGMICVSLRKGSINKTLEGALAKRFAAAGASPKIIDLGDFDMPIYHADIDQPENVIKLVSAMKSCDGIVIISPEYNGGLPPLLKNAIDWTSKVSREHLSGPIYGIASCTDGPMSGIMVMRQINYILTRLQAEVISTQVGCGNFETAFDADGNLTGQPASDLADTMIKRMLTRISQKG